MMLKRHENELMGALEQLYGVGFVEIPWYKIRLWYGSERISKYVWRDLQDRIAEIDDTVVLYSYDTGIRNAGSLLLCCGNYLKALSARLGEEGDQ